VCINERSFAQLKLYARAGVFLSQHPTRGSMTNSDNVVLNLGGLSNAFFFSAST
jgi:hypothetical protein